MRRTVSTVRAFHQQVVCRIGCRTAAAALVFAASVFAGTASADVVIMRDGTEYGRDRTKGKIRSATYETVKYRLDGTRSDQSLQGDQILRIEWSTEGRSTRSGRAAMAEGKFEDAVKRFTADFANSNSLYAGNAKYLAGEAYLRWSAQDSAKAGDAVKAFEAFLAGHEGEKHFYVPQALSGLARAQIAKGAFGDAETSFKKLSSGDMGSLWGISGKLGLAEVKLAQDKFQDARGLFSQLINDRAVQDDDEYSARSLVGYAKSQLGTGQRSGAIETVKDKLLLKADGRPTRLDRYASQGFLVWGQAEEADAGSDKKAIQFAVVRYYRAISIASVSSEEYAEGLYRVMKAWQKLNRSDQAERAKQRLLKECPRSPWATRAKQ